MVCYFSTLCLALVGWFVSLVCFCFRCLVFPVVLLFVVFVFFVRCLLWSCLFYLGLRRFVLLLILCGLFCVVGVFDCCSWVLLGFCWMVAVLTGLMLGVVVCYCLLCLWI